MIIVEAILIWDFLARAAGLFLILWATWFGCRLVARALFGRSA